MVIDGPSEAMFKGRFVGCATRRAAVRHVMSVRSEIEEKKRLKRLGRSQEIGEQKYCLTVEELAVRGAHETINRINHKRFISCPSTAHSRPIVSLTKLLLYSLYPHKPHTNIPKSTNQNLISSLFLKNPKPPRFLPYKYCLVLLSNSPLTPPPPPRRRRRRRRPWRAWRTRFAP